MGFMASWKAQQAMRAHQKGDKEKAKQLYKEALDKGLMEARPMLAYALLLIREGSFEEAMALLTKTQKAPDLTPDRKSQLFVDYAACCAKTGQLEKGIRLSFLSDYQQAPTARSAHRLVISYAGIDTEKLPEVFALLAEMI